MSAVMQVVSGIGGSLVFDLNSRDASGGCLMREGSILGEVGLAELQPGIVWSPLTGPAGLESRTISIPFVVIGASPDNAGARVASLSAAVRSSWWLRVRRHGASQDSWLRCKGCVPQVEQRVTGQSGAFVVGTIVAETDPAAYGARVDQAAVAVSADPSGSAWALDVNGVGGDSLTPAVLRLNDTTAHQQAMGAYISVRRRGTPSNLTATALTVQAETASTVNGTNATWSTVTGDTAFSGSSAKRLTFSSTYATPAGAFLYVPAPTLTGGDVPGTYRLLMRVRRTSNGEKRIVVKPYTRGGQLNPEDVTIPAQIGGGSGLTYLVDLGLAQWPANQPAGLVAPFADDSGATTSGVTLAFWQLEDGAGQLDVDYVAWVPADEDGGYFYLEPVGLQNAATQTVVIDGYQNMAVATTADPTTVHSIVSQGYTSSIPSTVWIGGVPRLAPGSNRIFLVPGTSIRQSWPITRTWSCAVSYWPRYTWLR